MKKKDIVETRSMFVKSTIMSDPLICPQLTTCRMLDVTDTKKSSSVKIIRWLLKDYLSDRWRQEAVESYERDLKHQK